MNLTGHITHLRGSKNGLPKLTMQVRIKNNLGHGLAVLSTSAEVHAARGPDVHGISAAASFLGPAQVQLSSSQLANGAESTWSIALPLSHQLLQHVESLRRRADLVLMLAVQYVAAVTDQTGPIRFTQGTLNSDSGSGAFVPLRVPRSDWIAVLQELGYGDYYLIEIPLRGVPERGELAKALGLLTSAWGHFSQGLNADTLSNCYRCFERIAKDHGAAHPDQNGWEKVLGGIDAKKREKLKHLLHYVSGFMHLGRHEHGETDRAELDGSDAEYALILTQATLGYLPRLWSSRAANSSRDTRDPESSAPGKTVGGRKRAPKRS
jgi:hypothetical protein